MHCNNKAFYLETDFISPKIWHVILYLVTPPLAVMTAWILFGIAECVTARSPEFKVHRICVSKNVCLLYLTSD